MRIALVSESFYPADGTSNLYSAAMHRSQANGKAYGFAFDDVADLSPSINSVEPVSARLNGLHVKGRAAGRDHPVQSRR